MDGVIRLAGEQLAYLEEQFGALVPRHILSNGWDYYTNRRVLTLEVIDGNSIYGAVNGSSVYAVVLDSDEFSYSKCTCSYAGYCKHMAAVFYHYCALAGEDPEQMYRHLISEGTIAEKRVKREMASQQPSEQDGPDVWREWFGKMYGDLWKQCKQSVHPLQSVLSELKAAAKHWEKPLQRLHWLHAIEFLLEQVERAYEATDSYSRYYYEMSFNRTVDPWISNFYELAQGLPRAPHGEGYRNWLSKLVEVLRELALADKPLLLRWDLLYHMIAEQLASEPGWREAEHAVLERELAARLPVDSSAQVAQTRSRPITFLQSALANLDMLDSLDASAVERMQWTDFERTSELAYRFARRRLEQRSWEAFALWMDFLYERLEGSRNTAVLRPYLVLCREADQQQARPGTGEWTRRLVGFLPASYHELASHWLQCGCYEEWADLQLYLGIRPDELDAADVRSVARSAPASLIPLYHQAIDEAIMTRNRQGYRQAVKLMKRLEKLYSEDGRAEKWVRYVSGIADKYQRLRAFQEELWKGKVLT